VTAAVPRSVTAELVYADGGFRAGWVLELAPEGRIRRAGPGRGAEAVFRDAALVPGFVNAHSHAFQRVLRGRTARAGAAPDFWSWRAAMYAAANALDADALYEVSRAAFAEMVAAGYTAVGEFHYLHRDPDGQPYPDPHTLAERVVRAALDAGLRIALLDAFYERAGVDADDLAPEQRRFRGPDGGVDAFLSGVEEFAERWRGEPRVTVGVAAHSVRAVRPESLRALAAWSARSGRPLHLHLDEQRREVEDCVRTYGCRPGELAARCGVWTAYATAVHATHADGDELDAIARGRSRICVCPTTEADLGDGIAPASEIARRGIPLCLGSDSQARIDPFEEMRRLEQHERLRLERRDALGAAVSRRGPGAYLIDVATEGGASSLGVPAGALGPGRWADWVVVDLDHPVLAGADAETLAETLALAADPRVVRETWVGGVRVFPRAGPASGSHP
jgi:formimidoylglutamate deiminase